MRRRREIVFFMVAWVVALVAPALAQNAGPWKQEVAAGYSQQTGNTQNSKFTGNYEGTRKTDQDELLLKAGTLYSTQNKKMDGQKTSGSARYAPTMGDTQWYNFCKAEADHDRFASIDYRILPSVGIGYWFSDTEDWKAQADIGLGYEYTNYNTGTDDESLVLIPHGLFEKALFENSKISEDFTWYPSLEDAKVYRLRSETRFTNALSEALALRASFIEEFNTDPLGDKKKNDTQLILALVCSF